MLGLGSYAPYNPQVSPRRRPGRDIRGESDFILFLLPGLQAGGDRHPSGAFHAGERIRTSQIRALTVSTWLPHDLALWAVSAHARGCQRRTPSAQARGSRPAIGLSTVSLTRSHDTAAGRATKTNEIPGETTDLAPDSDIVARRRHEPRRTDSPVQPLPALPEPTRNARQPVRNALDPASSPVGCAGSPCARVVIPVRSPGRLVVLCSFGWARRLVDHLLPGLLALDGLEPAGERRRGTRK